MNEDIQFLKDLQKELNEQANDGQASTRFWMIMDYRIVPTHEDYGADRISYYHNDGDHTEFNNVKELKEFLTDYFLEDDEEGELQELIDKKDTTFEELWDFVETELNEDGFFSEVPVKEESFISENTMFLTKEEAKRHLDLNHYHYSNKAHTYAMTAWRAPKVERLLKVLSEFDFESIN